LLIMDRLVATVGAAIGIFTGTNVDDVVVMTVLFLGSRAGGLPRPRQIVAGQYLGMAVLVAVSATAALGLAAVPDRWVRLLGLVPLGLGVAGLVGTVRARSAGDRDAPVVARGTVAVVGLTIAAGADNVAVYTPAFRAAGAAGSVVMVVVFAVLVGAWCVAAAWLGSHRGVVRAVERTGGWVVPVVFIALGVLILSGLWV
jgi:cadmium resistance protein CadD (predicted permease)